MNDLAIITMTSNAWYLLNHCHSLGGHMCRHFAHTICSALHLVDLFQLRTYPLWWSYAFHGIVNVIPLSCPWRSSHMLSTALQRTARESVIYPWHLSAEDDLFLIIVLIFGLLYRISSSLFFRILHLSSLVLCRDKYSSEHFPFKYSNKEWQGN